MRYLEFKKLCKYCDDILISNKNSILTLAYSKLHVIKNHPEFNKDYFLTTKNKVRKNFFFGIFKYFKNFIIEKPNFYLKRKNNDKVDVLVVSHLLNIKHLNTDSDFYYGSLIKKLKEINYSSKIILRNETILSSKYLFKNLNKDKVLLSKRTFILNELKYFFLAFLEFLKLNFFYNKYKIKQKKINFFSLRSFGYIISNLRINFQITNLIKIFEPKYIIITFEGHAWERVIIANIKKNHKDIKVYAYQFSGITINHHSLFRPLGKNFDPDCILTTGKYTYDIFKKKYKHNVKIIGSKKSKKKISKLISKNNQKTVLILPEAYISESKELLSFAIKVSQINKEYKFYLRLHPMIDSKELNFDLSKYPNIKLSTSNLEYDFKRSKIIFFKGSASALEAAAHGLKPIYIGKFNQNNVNPLYQVLNKKYYITDPKDFAKKIQSFNLIELKKINKYSNNYFEKMSIKKNFFDI